MRTASVEKQVQAPCASPWRRLANPGEDMTDLRKELEAPTAERRFGSGWISGGLALTVALLGLATLLCLRFPELLTLREARDYYNVGLIRLALHVVLIAGFVLGILSL